MADNYLEYRMEDIRSGRATAKKFVPKKKKANTEAPAMSPESPASINNTEMKKIASFCVDHTRLERGVYVSRKDVTPSGDVVTTFDVRMTRPNRDEALDPRALHAMEHLVATYLRNDPTWGSKIVYWGPMGCCTGNYLLLSGDFESKDVLDLLKGAMAFVAAYEGEIPGATARDCGNYTYMDLPAAKEAARRYLEILRSKDLPLQYPD